MDNYKIAQNKNNKENLKEINENKQEIEEKK